MRQINGIVEIRISTDDIAKLNVLIERDEPKPQKIVKDVAGKKLYAECPVCGRVVCSVDKFCSDCGQRLDLENEAL